MVKYGHYFGLAVAGAGVSPFPYIRSGRSTIFSKKKQLRRGLKRLERSRYNLRCSKIDEELDRNQLAPGSPYRKVLSDDIRRIDHELELVDVQIQEKQLELAAVRPKGA